MYASGNLFKGFQFLLRKYSLTTGFAESGLTHLRDENHGAEKDSSEMSGPYLSVK